MNARFSKANSKFFRFLQNQNITIEEKRESGFKIEKKKEEFREANREI